MTPLYIVILVLLGLCFGSFSNALTWRLHEQSKPAKKRAASREALSMTKGRSMCVHCQHVLAPLDLVPLFSWLFLHGKCRYCRKPIDDNPLAELFLPIAFVTSYIWWPYGFESINAILFAIWLIVLVGFTVLTIYDLRWMLLPNKVVYPLIAGVGLFDIARVVSAPNWLGVMVQIVASVVIAGGIFHLLFMFSDGKWIGGGDVKLGYLIGLIVGRPSLAMLVLFAASCLGLLFILPSLVTGKASKSSRIPFGPFLILGTYISMLFGQQIIDWYLRLAGLSQF